MRPSLRTVALAVSAWLLLAPAARAEVRLTIRNGRVTIMAKDATVRQILAEWARVGRTRIVNGERVPGGVLTLELKDVPEADALDVLLRTLSGYMAAPRATLGPADVSVYDAIVVMPTVAAATSGRIAPPSNAPPVFSPPVFNPTNDDEGPEGGGPTPGRPGGPGAAPVRPPIFSTFPSPQQGNPNAQRPMLPVVRPGIVPQQNNTNPATPGDRPFSEAGPNGESPQTAPTTAPSSGGLVGTSAPGMLPPGAASQPGQVAPQRPNTQ